MDSMPYLWPIRKKTMQSSSGSFIFTKTAPVKRKPSTRSYNNFFGIVIFVALLGGGFYATPFISLSQLKSAIIHRDPDKIACHVDFPLLRESLKSEFYGHALADTAGDGSKIASNLLAAGFAEMAIDIWVTPEGVSALMCGTGLKNPEDLGSPAEQESTNRLFEQGKKSPEMSRIMDQYREKPPEEVKTRKEPVNKDLQRDSLARAIKHDVKFTMRWKNLDTFAVRAKNENNNQGEIELFFRRKALTWKLVGVKLPLDQ
jgi:hypothetical protein